MDYPYEDQPEGREPQQWKPLGHSGRGLNHDGLSPTAGSSIPSDHIGKRALNLRRQQEAAREGAIRHPAPTLEDAVTRQSSSLAARVDARPAPNYTDPDAPDPADVVAIDNLNRAIHSEVDTFVEIEWPTLDIEARNLYERWLLTPPPAREEG